MTTSEVVTRHGQMRVVNEDIWVSRALRELGEYSESELQMMKMVLGLMSHGWYDSVVVEAGAYIGDLTVPLSRYCKRLYAFEPQEEIREILIHNLRINDCRNVEVLPYALGDSAGDITYKSPDQKWEEDHDSPGSIQMGDAGGRCTAPMVTLDSLDLDVDFLKADVEGMEIPLLAGAMNTMERLRTTLFLERDTVIYKDSVSLGAVVEMLGYDYYPMSFPIYGVDNIHKAPNTFGTTVSHMALCIPRLQTQAPMVTGVSL